MFSFLIGAGTVLGQERALFTWVDCSPASCDVSAAAGAGVFLRLRFHEFVTVSPSGEVHADAAFLGAALAALPPGLRAGMRMSFADGDPSDPAFRPPPNIPAAWVEKGKGRWTPRWELPVVDAAHETALAAIAAQVAAHPEKVAWIDIGSYGLWGEFHYWKRPSLTATVQDRVEILDAYDRAFPAVPLVIPFDVFDLGSDGRSVVDAYPDGGEAAARRLLRDRLTGMGAGIRHDTLNHTDQEDHFADVLKVAGIDRTSAHADLPGLWGGEMGNDRCMADTGACVERVNGTVTFLADWGFVFVSGQGTGTGELCSAPDTRLCESLTMERFEVARIAAVAARKKPTSAAP